MNEVNGLVDKSTDQFAFEKYMNDYYDSYKVYYYGGFGEYNNHIFQTKTPNQTESKHSIHSNRLMKPSCY